MTYGINNPNGLKTQETTLGMPESGYVVLTINDGGEGNSFNANYSDADSVFARAVKAVSMYSEVYGVYEPGSTEMSVQVRGDSLPLAQGQALGDGAPIDKISAIASEMLGFYVTAWNAKMADDQLSWNF